MRKSGTASLLAMFWAVASSAMRMYLCVVAKERCCMACISSIVLRLATLFVANPRRKSWKLYHWPSYLNRGVIAANC